MSMRISFSLALTCQEARAQWQSQHRKEMVCLPFL